MNKDELDALTEAEYSRIKTPKYDLQILKNPPPVVLTYDDTEHFEPSEVTDYFHDNPNEPGLLHSDGYLYQNNLGMNGSFHRMKNIGKEIHRIVSSQEIQEFLSNITNEKKLRITPEGWDSHHVENGFSDEDKKTIYINSCYFIPNEEVYRMSVSASKSRDNPLIDLSIFITQPEELHFDGQDHINYKIHLELVLGTINNQNLLRTPTQRIISYNR